MLSERHVACYPDAALVGGNAIVARGVGADRSIDMGQVSPFDCLVARPISSTEMMEFRQARIGV
jgi:hypothetical protein